MLAPIRCEWDKPAWMKMVPDRFALTNIAPERLASRIDAWEQFALTNRILVS